MIKKILEEELNKIRHIQSICMETLKKTPKATIRCATNKGCFQYYDGNQYLRKEKIEYIKMQLNRDYCEKLHIELEQYEKKLCDLLDLYKHETLENVYRHLTPARKVHVNPIINPIERKIMEFENTIYTGKQFEENDETEYFTNKGERVRSKSEVIIANEFFHYGIPYKYEKPLILKEKNKEITVYPDFTTMNKRTGKLWIIEHFGMMSIPQYCEMAMHKLDLYLKNNYLIGKNLLLFYEYTNAPLKVSNITKYIKEFLI